LKPLPASLSPKGSLLGRIKGLWPRLARVARWENVANIHLMTCAPDGIAHHHCVLRRSNKGDRAVKVTNSVGVHPNVVIRHEGYQDFVLGWVSGRYDDEFIKLVELNFELADVFRGTKPPRAMSNAPGQDVKRA
jgi:hypothetical protein